jgi:SH3-like domain-containing protein
MSELNTGEGTILRAAPADSAKQLRRITPDNEPKQVRIRACQGKWLQVSADDITGWTRSWCNNQRTTCS